LREQAEINILKFISSEINNLKSATGISVDDIDLNFVSVFGMGERRERILSNVFIEMKL